MKIIGIRNFLAGGTIAVVATSVIGCSDDITRLVQKTDTAINFSMATISESRSRGGITASQISHCDATKFEDAETWLIASEKEISGDMLSSSTQPYMTRAAMPSVNDVSSFYVNAYTYENSGDWEDNYGIASLYLSEEVTKSDNNLWSSTTPRYWPGEKYTMKFFGHTFLYLDKINSETGEMIYGSRKTSDGTEIRLSKNWPMIKYDSEVCSDDFVVAVDVESSSSTYSNTLPGDYKQPVKLHFYHALSAITFTADAEIEDEIESITIEGVRTIGKHTFGDEEWTFYASDGTEYTKGSLSFPLKKSSDAEQFPKMVIPQSLKDAVVKVKFSTGKELTASLKSKCWRMGKCITYHISDKKEYNEWIVDGLDDFTTSWMGGDTISSITSYIIQHSIHEGTDEVGTKIVPVPWTATVSSSDSWIQINTVSGSGSVDAEDFKITLGKQTSTYSNEHNDKLRNTAPVSGIYDLSTNGGTTSRSTANCYLVNALGQYMLPLVFGNAITNGEKKENAYYIPTSNINGVNSQSKLERFKGYDRTGITTPYIYELHNGSSNYKDVVTDATLCWQDGENLVTNVRLDSEKKNLLFDINKSTIQQGNAVVAVRDSQKRIMWSWHIWVTDYVLGSDIKEVTNHGIPGSIDYMTNHFMPYNLGYCDEGIYKYEGRKGTITITQSYGGETNSYTMTVEQREHVFHPSNNTYYQWGRKDPMLPGYFEEDGKGYDPITHRYQLVVSNKEQFYTDEKYKFRLRGSNNPGPGEENADIANAIQYPYIFFTYDGNWLNWPVKMIVNFWIGNNGGDVWKTVYDPCPPGFTIPSAKVFTGFTWDGNDVTNIAVNDAANVEKVFDEEINSYFRTVDDFTRNFGFTFYCGQMSGKGIYDTSAGTINFPVIGYRPGDGSSDVPLEVGHYSYTWSGNPDFSNGAAWYMMFGISEDYIDIITRTIGGGTKALPINLSNGFSVRPIREY